MEKNTNVPRLRFPEFVGEWEEKKLREVIISLDSGVSVNSIDKPIGDGNEYGILKTSCISSGIFNPEENKIIVDNEISRARLNPLADTILISRMNTPQLVGESGYVTINYPNLFIPDRIWMAISERNIINTKLLSTILSSPKVMTQISNIATGTSNSMKNISKPNFLNLEIKIPPYPEQTKIASFLTAAENKLTQLKKKKSLLDEYKKGVMQKIFSQELRFKDENGEDFPEWEEKRLGDIAELTSSKRVYLSDYVVEGVPFYRGKEISELKQNKQPKDILYISEEAYNSFKSTYGVPSINDLLITAVGTLGNVWRITNNEPFYFKDGNLIWMRNIKQNSDFLEILLEVKYKEIEKTAIGSSQKALTMVELNKLSFYFPSLPEQTKIANFLSAIDERINHCSKQIERMEDWKKGLLQQMFI